MIIWVNFIVNFKTKDISQDTACHMKTVLFNRFIYLIRGQPAIAEKYKLIKYTYTYWEF